MLPGIACDGIAAAVLMEMGCFPETPFLPTTRAGKERVEPDPAHMLSFSDRFAVTFQMSGSDVFNEVVIDVVLLYLIAILHLL